jgi:hypothetical protein
VISIIDSTGEERFLGNLEPPSGHVCKAFPVYGDTADAPMFTRAELIAIAEKTGNDMEYPWLPPVHDQNGKGQCNADATTAMAESCRMSQGLPLILLSAADLYDRINGGSDRGSLLEDAMAEMLKNGVGTQASCGAVWKPGNPKPPAGERARFKFLEVFTCPTLMHYFSGLAAGFRGNTGIMWGDNYNPDGDGWLPETPRGGGGHSLFSYKLAHRNGKLGAVTQNSWASRWGVQGKCIIPEAAFRGPVGGWFVVRAITDEGGIVPPEK